MKRGLLVGDALLTGTPFHDELQVEVSDEWSHKVGHSFVEGIRQTGTYYDMRIRLDGEYKIGAILMHGVFALQSYSNKCPYSFINIIQNAFELMLSPFQYFNYKKISYFQQVSGQLMAQRKATK